MFGRKLAVIALCLLAATCATAGTLPVTLTDAAGPNASVNVSATSGTGVDQWNVLNVNQMTRNWYWFRIGSGPGTAAAIDTIGTAVVNHPTGDYATVTYSNASYTVQVGYTLVGGPSNSGTSDLAETVLVTNNTAAALDFHLFEIINFDLNNTAGNDAAVHDAGSGNLTQTDGAYPGLQAQVGVNGFSHWQVDTASALYSKINGSSFTNLTDSVVTATGDVAWGMQKDFSIAAHGTSSISEDILVQGAPVPEAGSLASLGFGLAGVIPMIRRKR